MDFCALIVFSELHRRSGIRTQKVSCAVLDLLRPWPRTRCLWWILVPNNVVATPKVSLDPVQPWNGDVPGSSDFIFVFLSPDKDPWTDKIHRNIDACDHHAHRH